MVAKEKRQISDTAPSTTRSVKLPSFIPYAQPRERDLLAERHPSRSSNFDKFRFAPSNTPFKRIFGFVLVKFGFDLGSFFGLKTANNNHKKLSLRCL